MKIVTIEIPDPGEGNITVRFGERWEELGSDEALYVVAQILIHPDKFPRYLRTAEEHAAMRALWAAQREPVTRDKDGGPLLLAAGGER